MYACMWDKPVVKFACGFNLFFTLCKLFILLYRKEPAAINSHWRITDSREPKPKQKINQIKHLSAVK